VPEVLLYARLSVSKDESVSIARQLEAGRQYAAARGWNVTGEFTDDGVSATRSKPEDRAGWRALLTEADRSRPLAVVVWKVDRLARSVLDFLNADSTLRTHGSGIVAVSDPVDMTSPQGRAFATVLAVFAELEAASIAARVTDARRALIAQGRRAGGRPPYGYCNAPNPAGPGYVLGQVPAEIEAVRQGVELALSGQSLYAVARHFDAHAPRRPHGNAKHAGWAEESVESILRNPALAGLTPYAPGRKPGSPADPWAVLRDADGLPVVDESAAILTLAERQRLLDVLDARQRPGSRPQQRRDGTGARPVSLLSRLAVCGSCGGHLARATAGGYRVLRCQNRSCPAPVTVTEAPLIEHVTEDVLAERGQTRIHQVTEYRDDSSELARIAEALRAASQQLAVTDDPAEEERLLGQIASLKARRAEARSAAVPATTKRIVTPTRGQQAWGQEFTEALEADDLASAARLLREQVVKITVKSTGACRRMPLSERVSVGYTSPGGLA